jgi:nicotinamidase-related amidase
MKPPVDQDYVLEKLLAGTPLRVVDAFTAHMVDGRAEIDATQEALAALALSLEPMAPSTGLRARIAASLTGAPQNTRRSALVVMDMLLDHLTPGAALEVPRARDIVPAVQERIAAAHAAGEPVVYLIDHHEAGDPELDAWPLHNTRDPRDEVWPELKPQAGELVVTHRAYSGFHETALDGVLRSLDVNTVVLTGCITEIHLFATATDALQRGYRLEMPEDCQAGSSEGVEKVILGTLSVMAPTLPLPG